MISSLPEDDEYDTGALTKELIEKERSYRAKNKQLTLQVTKVLEQAQHVVKEGRELLTRPLTAPSAPRAAENDSGIVRVKKHNKHASVDVRIFQPQPVEETKDTLLGAGLNTKVEDIGAVATTRFLKAKMQVLQQELDGIVTDRQEKDHLITILEEKLKSTEDERSKAVRASLSSQTQLDKIKKQYEGVLKNNESITAENQRLSRELESFKKQNKQMESEIQNKDIRALEEAEKYKQTLAIRGTDAKDQLEISRKTADQLYSDNKKLQKQKADLFQAFKKQGQLIDVLKRQKLHIQSAKLLEFSEEEFMRAIDSDH